MFNIADLHNHSLFGLDDGADSFETMCRMIEMSYSDGVRCICFTPHYFNIGERDCTPEHVMSSFELAQKYCAEHFPDLKLYLGSEMLYHYDCIDSIAQKKLYTVADSRYVLVDFLATPDVRGIVKGLERLLNCGYVPIIAHIERYPCLHGKTDEIFRMSEMGAVIQINASSLFGGFMSKKRRQCLKLLKRGLVDVVASDAHNCDSRSPSIKKTADFVESKCGKAYAECIFWENSMKIVSNQRL